MPSTFALAYSDALKELTTPELQKIKLLRDLARENPSEAENVVNALVDHIISCTPAQRLPAVYLIDCILKSAGGKYPELLAKVMAQVFSYVWDSATPDLRSRLVKTASTWSGHLPADVISAVTASMQPLPVSTAPSQQSLLSGGKGSHVAVPAAVPAVSAAPVATAAPAPQFLQMNAAGQPMIATLPGAAAMLGALPPGLAYAFASGTAAAQPLTAFTFPTATATYGGVLLPALQTAALQAAPHAPATLPPTGVTQGTGTATPAPDNTQARSGSGGGSGSPPGSAQGSGDAAVEALFAATATTRQKFKDYQFARNRRLASTTHRVRPWFVSEAQWLEGARAAEEVHAVFQEDEPQVVSAASAELPLIEEDPAQPTCALSGEAFERTYDPVTDKWYLEDAVRLTGEQARAYGVMDGSIVKVHCLAGAAPTLSAPESTVKAAAVTVTSSTVPASTNASAAVPVAPPTTDSVPTTQQPGGAATSAVGSAEKRSLADAQATDSVTTAPRKDASAGSQSSVSTMPVPAVTMPQPDLKRIKVE